MSGVLKPGTLCWLTKVRATQDKGKIVEVVGFFKTHPLPELGDVYCIRSRTPLFIENLDPLTGESFNTFALKTECKAFRSQLIPINDPDQTTDEIEQCKREKEAT
jgi:hypothetical protein